MFRTLAAAMLAFVLAVPALALAQNAPTTASSSSEKTTPININTATVAEFEALPGIGPKMAQRIVEYRDKNGAFKKLEDLMNVKGIGEKNFLKLKAQLTVAPPKH
jgi:competence protein ComEA